MNDIDYELYKGKTFGALCKDIVKNSEEKKTQLEVVITDLREMVKTLNDAVTVLPLMEAYFEVGVRNDEQLIKLAAIIQRLISGKLGGDGEGGLIAMTDEERKQLMAVVEEVAKPIDKEPELQKETSEAK